MRIFKRKRVGLLIVLVVVLGVLAYIVLRDDEHAAVPASSAKETAVPPVSTIKPVTIEGIKVPAKVGSTYIQINHNGQWENMLIKGINLGVTKPGYFPGDMGVTKDDYLRWFQTDWGYECQCHKSLHASSAFLLRGAARV